MGVEAVPCARRCRSDPHGADRAAARTRAPGRSSPPTSPSRCRRSSRSTRSCARTNPTPCTRCASATRRLRSALATFRRLLDRAVTEPIRDELKWLAGILGAARDAEVIHARLEKIVADEPPGLVAGPVAERIDATMRARYEAAHREVLSALDSDRYLALLDALDEVATGAVVGGDRAARKAGADCRRRSGGPSAAGAVRSTPRGRRPGRHGRPRSNETDVHLHEVRKAAKRVRYAGEAVEPVIGRPAKRLAERMEDLQEVLGQHQDGIVTGRVIAQLADDAQGRRRGHVHLWAPPRRRAAAVRAGRRGRAGADRRAGRHEPRLVALTIGAAGAREHGRMPASRLAGPRRRTDRRPAAGGDDRRQPGPHRRRPRQSSRRSSPATKVCAGPTTSSPRGSSAWLEGCSGSASSRVIASDCGARTTPSGRSCSTPRRRSVSCSSTSTRPTGRTSWPTP